MDFRSYVSLLKAIGFVNIRGLGMPPVFQTIPVVMARSSDSFGSSCVSTVVSMIGASGGFNPPETKVGIIAIIGNLQNV